MTHLCRCQRDLHDHPLSEKVAKFWATHTFPESYDPELDDSPIVCPGSYTEGPLPAQHTHTIISLYDSMWSFIGSLEGSFKIAVWTESPIQKAYNAIKKMANTLENLTCEKSDVVIEFGPKNWPVEPKPIWTFWQPWHNSVPSIHSEAWQEPIQLPDLPVDYSKVAEKINQQQFPTFGKLIGVANAY